MRLSVVHNGQDTRAVNTAPCTRLSPIATTATLRPEHAQPKQKSRIQRFEFAQSVAIGARRCSQGRPTDTARTRTHVDQASATLRARSATRPPAHGRPGIQPAASGSRAAMPCPATLPPAASTAVEATASTPPPASGAHIIQRKCASCHGLDVVYGQKRSAREWGAVLAQMIGYGAQLTPQERRVLMNQLPRK